MLWESAVSNVYAGLSGFWLLRDDIEASLGLPGPPTTRRSPETNYYDIPLSIQDKSFNEDGSLYYPESRRTYEGYQGAFMPDTNIPQGGTQFFKATQCW